MRLTEAYIMLTFVFTFAVLMTMTFEEHYLRHSQSWMDLVSSLFNDFL